MRSRHFSLILICNSASTAALAHSCGVDEIMVDLEIDGKVERQRNRDTFISTHALSDVGALRAVLPRPALMVRINPWSNRSPAEVEQVISSGADSIMLPMYRAPHEVANLASVVAGRVGIVPLVETIEALSCVGPVARIHGVTRLHFGLNDLHLAMGVDFMFRLLVDGTLDAAAAELRECRMPFGIGGVARVGEGLLPGERVVGEHVRLGSSCAILSRTFHRRNELLNEAHASEVLSQEIARLRASYAHFLVASPDVVQSNHMAAAAAVSEVATRMRAGAAR